MKNICEPTQEESSIQQTKKELKQASYYTIKYVRTHKNGFPESIRKMHEDAMTIQLQYAQEFMEYIEAEEKSKDLSLKRKKQD